ncbi:class A beta-lactamase-related serine hydrolase [Actinoplanes bogorensis]|uniref:Class A beta-lactamase-related serine hydrolase n=1 Tax=Paractinoplanes bogorensis TaxID=1610840 RepID=A0ABS5YUV4_9ACTN|nr:serine hydrolase [Actinoplanes bogorensis]MBU2665865.1 class A beta-lactamase-related serine hydrolase [Actinoplanes bogorensis]
MKPPIVDDLGITATAFAAPIGGGDGVGFGVDELVTPASVMKINVGLAVARAIAAGEVDAEQPVVLRPDDRTPGPTGISLMRDEVRMSVRDLLTLMLTISDNAATDTLIELVGLDRVNAFGLPRTRIVDDLRTMLDTMAAEVGFANYAALARSDAAHDLSRTAALDPARGSHTTAADTVRLLRTVWADPAAGPVREAMAQQLTRHRIATGFGPRVRVAAKSGGLMGVVRNEAGVVTRPGGDSYAVAVFTRRPPGVTTDPARIDAAIGTIARHLVDGVASGR